MTENFVFEYSGLKVSEMFCSVLSPAEKKLNWLLLEMLITPRRMNEIKMTYIYSPGFLIGSLINSSLINYRIYFDLRPVDQNWHFQQLFRIIAVFAYLTSFFLVEKINTFKTFRSERTKIFFHSFDICLIQLHIV